MFLHLGSDTLVRLDDVVGIFDLVTTRSKDTREFLDLARAESRLVRSISAEPKAFVLVGDRAYLSPISSTTLMRRAPSGSWRTT